MKLHIDTEAKTIKVDGSVKFVELMDELDKRFPENEWEDYTLEATVTVVNNYPISYPIIPYTPAYPGNPWTTTTITYLANT